MTVRKSPELEECSDSDDLVEFGSSKRVKTEAPVKPKAVTKTKITTSACFVGPPLSREEARRRWPDRYPKVKGKKSSDETPVSEKKQISNGDEGEHEDGVGECVAHYLQAEVDGCNYELGDFVYVNAGEGPDYIGRIIEFFETADGSYWLKCRWFFRAHDTAIGDIEGKKHDEKRIFYSECKDNNPLECIVSKLKIVRISPLHHFNNTKPKPIPPCDYYYDMGYDYAYSRFYTLPTDEAASSDSDLTVCNDVSNTQAPSEHSENKSDSEVSSRKRSVSKTEMTLLDLYSGCGGMSTGLCMGASVSGVKLVTKWAVDLNEYACKSLKYNHPETQVRNMAAEDFLALIKEWKKLCDKHCTGEDVEDSKAVRSRLRSYKPGSTEDSSDESETSDLEEGEYEVERFVDIRYVGASSSKKSGLEFKVRWKGYGPSDDTWEPLESLGECEEVMKRFVKAGNKAVILPLPGGVDVLCGGPPCQGASGFNRFRNKEDPLADARNKQIVVYMDIVDFLKPRFILMENVVDILKFAGGVLGRYALSRLVQMHYQAKLGLMVAGCYGLPQFRMRVLLWGASPLEKLPPYALPTHDVVQKGGIPQEWERNVVAYDETQTRKLLKALTLGDALSDLPPVKNSESRDEMPYGRGAKTEFQRFIRLPKEVLTGECTLSACKGQKLMLHDHRPLELNTDDFQRTCRIPKAKGANFRDLPGVIVGENNTVALDPQMERILLPSGKPLVPDYAITFVNGRSSKPFGRLWWDETVPTVVTRAEPHNQVILHPEQDRVLTIRENARLQGFPDYYKLFGPVKQRYIQVGNAVAVPVARALGYGLGLAVIGTSCPVVPVVELPPNFPVGIMAAQQQIDEIPLDVEDSA